ncbi:hypothetical protein SAMN02745127_01331 [Oceanospirillum multiglobuliferum]|uniref:Uncharacterized protein n=1 Tax=Oceanospirillum multiglobuliferum TaxID=64969 RepID=A0A1T4P3Y2_9GAMM|nr:hypothetical protein [Oceanospirillum multiglobuliferum]OPX55111.1 hypothetical protein BTE48_10815 [Oceanospirillum multiglobuliferum]SJZ85638.1 hypothetical protein SAMN02745127_01331 [Oceanospirillum multiglobuliferum]
MIEIEMTTLSSASKAIDHNAELSTQLLSKCTDIEKAVKALKPGALSKIVTAMKGVGTAISIITFFMELGQESDTDRILKEISVLSGKIDRLQTLMINRFDRTENYISEVAAKQTLSSAIANISSAYTAVDTLRKAKNKLEREFALRNIMEINLQSIRTSVQEINSTINTSSTGNKIFKSILATSYGNADTINGIGMKVYSVLQEAYLVDIVVSILRSCHGKNVFSKLDVNMSIESQIEKLELTPLLEAAHNNSSDHYIPTIDILNEEWFAALKSCKDDSRKYICSYFETEALNNIEPNEKQKSASILVESLKNRWGWIDFFSVIYENVKGFNNHILHASSNNKIVCFRKNIKNVECNIIVVWVESTEDEKGSQYSDRVNYSVKERKKLYDLSYFYSPGFIHSLVNRMEAEKKDRHTISDTPHSDLRDMVKALDGAVRQSNKLFIFAFKSKTFNPLSPVKNMVFTQRDIGHSCSNPNRLKWEDGKYFAYGLFE